MEELDEVLQHYGVKGMKWGVSRARQKAGQVKTRIKEEINSSHREASWAKQLRDIHNMDSKKLQNTVNRLRNENDFKVLAKGQKVRNIGDLINKSADKKAYRNREKLSDKELQDKVQQLRLKDQLRQQVSNATKSHRKGGKELVESAGKKNVKLKPYVDIGKQLIDHTLGAY